MPVDFNTSEVIADLDTGTYLVTRRTSAGYGTTGRAQSGTASTFAIIANVQPASGRDLLRLPEGRRTTESVIIYTATLLQVGGQADAYEADRISIDGASWEVQQVQSWPGSPGYYRAIAQRVTS